MRLKQMGSVKTQTSEAERYS